eukprot:3240512-Prorocentrum_lima.AAC.1
MKLLLEQQQSVAVDMHQNECKVYQSCGMQQALGNRMLAEQNLQAKVLVESISAHVREQQRAQEPHLRTLSEEFRREK